MSIAKALLYPLTKIPGFASGQQIAEMIGTSWTALELCKDPAERDVDTLLVGAGVRRGTLPDTAGAK